MRSTARTAHALVQGLVDYAGLFPPAALDMNAAVESYADDLAGPAAWMLGRFVAPVAQLEELAAAATRIARRGASAPWTIAAVGSGDPLADSALIREINASHSGFLTVDVVEHRASTVRAVHAAARAAPADVTVYVELPIVDEPRPLLEATRAAGARAKVRTGGVVADAFPSAHALARFIVRCAELAVPFKATAGLHHPVRADHPLTYRHDAPRSTMFGFLGVFAAAALARAGAGEAVVAQLLEEREASAFVFGDETLRWRAHALSLDELAQARASLAISFGSCSFREPVADLRALQLIAP